MIGTIIPPLIDLLHHLLLFQLLGLLLVSDLVCDYQVQGRSSVHHGHSLGGVDPAAEGYKAEIEPTSTNFPSYCQAQSQLASSI